MLLHLIDGLTLRPQFSEHSGVLGKEISHRDLLSFRDKQVLLLHQCIDLRDQEELLCGALVENAPALFNDLLSTQFPPLPSFELVVVIEFDLLPVFLIGIFVFGDKLDSRLSRYWLGVARLFDDFAVEKPLLVDPLSTQSLLLAAKWR